MNIDVLLPFAIALGLGLLVGLQREWAAAPVAGIRTFTLITLLGALCGALGQEFGGWVVAAGLVGVAALLFMANLAESRKADFDAGMTTEVAALLMYGVGAAVALGWRAPAVAVAGAVAVLLHWKEPMHALVRRIGEGDFRAIIRFVLIAMVILPLLPNVGYGPYEVLNPYRIWLMVVLIVGISISAYVAYKLFGERGGTLLAGFLGGLISSTATTVSYARRTRSAPHLAPLAIVVVLLASSVVFVRVLVEVAIVEPSMLRTAAPPMLLMMGLLAVLGLIAFWRAGQQPASVLDADAPAELLSAVIFGTVYALVLLAVAFAQDWFGGRALYVVAALSGLTDMDAITLSTAQMVKSGRMEAALAWRLILTGAMANLVFKGGIVAIAASAAARRQVLVYFGIALVWGGAILTFWP